MKVGLTFACMNLKKLAKLKAKWGLLEERKPHKISILNAIRLIKEKMALGYKSQSRFVYSLKGLLQKYSFLQQPFDYTS